jgi:hypothetical protein
MVTTTNSMFQRRINYPVSIKNPVVDPDITTLTKEVLDLSNNNRVLQNKVSDLTTNDGVFQNQIVYLNNRNGLLQNELSDTITTLNQLTDYINSQGGLFSRTNGYNYVYNQSNNYINEATIYVILEQPKDHLRIESNKNYSVLKMFNKLQRTDDNIGQVKILSTIPFINSFLSPDPSKNPNGDYEFFIPANSLIVFTYYEGISTSDPLSRDISCWYVSYI